MASSILDMLLFLKEKVWTHFGFQNYKNVIESYNSSCKVGKKQAEVSTLWDDEIMCTAKNAVLQAAHM